MVLRHSSAFTRGVFESVAQGYPGIEGVIENVDAVALWMVQRPERFSVVVAENMFGDILSDLGAGVMGGLGFAPVGTSESWAHISSRFTAALRPMQGSTKPIPARCS